MGIRQIQARYDNREDRILLRLSTTDDCEFRFWLTRRFVKRFWSVMVKLLQQDATVRQFAEENTRGAVLGFRHEGYVQEGDFSREFEARPYRLPLGAEPVLVVKGTGKINDDGTYLLRLHPENGQGIDITLDMKLLHLVSKLLGDAVAQADWDIKLLIHGPGREAVGAEAPIRRRMN